MILYTTMPLEEILRDSQEEKAANYLQIPFSGGLIEVQLSSALTAKVVRLLSNNIYDYLNPKLQPGAEIQLKWIVE
ncbi:MAG: YlzJ-like family protein [Dethiobacteria bacterium]|jgi:hypothetical protein